MALDRAILLQWWRLDRNWGDAVNPVLAGMISEKPVYGYQEVINVRNRPVYSMIGSTLDSASIRNHVVWGAGFMAAKGRVRIEPSQICAIRGPLTRDIFVQQGIDCPEVYGDPALLMPRFYQPNTTLEFELGIVPHFVDQDSQWVQSMRDRSDVLIIDIRSDTNDFLDAISRCRSIASSSLHGLVAADAYGIPSVWLEISDKVHGEGFKFRDYFASVQRPPAPPVRVDRDTSINQVLDNLHLDGIDIDLDSLINACPFLPETR